MSCEGAPRNRRSLTAVSWAKISDPKVVQCTYLLHSWNLFYVWLKVFPCILPRLLILGFMNKTKKIHKYFFKQAFLFSHFVVLNNYYYLAYSETSLNFSPANPP